MDGGRANSDRRDELIQNKHEEYLLHIEQLKEEKQAKIILVERERDDKIQEIQNNRDQQIVGLEKQRSNKLQLLQSHFQDYISCLLDKHDNEAKLAESTFKDGVRNSMYDLNYQIKTCQLERNEAIKNAKFKFEQEIKAIPDSKSQIKYLKESLDLQIQIFNDSCHEKVMGLIQMQAIQDLRQQAGNVATGIKSSYNAEMDKLRKEHDECVCKESKNYQREIEHLQKESEKQIHVLTEDIGEKIVFLKDLYENKIEEEKTKMDQDINSIVEGSMCF